MNRTQSALRARGPTASNISTASGIATIIVADTVRISQISETHIALRNLLSPNSASKLASQTYWLSGLLNSRFCSAMLIASMVGTRARMPSTAIGGTMKTIGSLVPVFTATARSRMPLPTGMMRILGAALAIAALLAASEAQAQKKTLVIGMGSADAGKLDPHTASTTPDKGLLQYMFNGLVRMKPGQISPDTIEPDLAESWTSNPAGTEWTFHIRQGVQCHWGYGEFTAEDAAYSLKRAANKNTSSYSNDFSSIASADPVDKYTLMITLKNPVAGFLGYVANINGGNMVCKEAAEEMGDGFSKKPIGTGPFMFAEYQPQQYVRLVANKQYFRGAPMLDEIMDRYIPSDSSRDLAFQSGELDMIYGKQDQSWVDRTKLLPGVKVVAMEPGELSTLFLNVTQKPLDDIRVRQVIAYAVDRKAIV